MDSGDLDNLGAVHSLAIIQKPGTTEKFLFVGHSKDQDRWVRLITRGAAQALWHYLTQILYPRAADQLTHRAATAALTEPDEPAITTTFVVQYNEDDALIRVRGLGGKRTWSIEFNAEEGYELWASLEDVLDSV